MASKTQTKSKPKRSVAPRAKRSKKSIKRNPTQLSFPIASTAVSSEMIVQVDKIASNSNHRLYKQGKVYHARVTHDPNVLGGAQSIDVYVLNDTWFLANAWKFAKRTFMAATKEERESLAPEQRAKWYDFRIDDGIPSAASARVINMAPNGAGQALSQGEYDYSRLEDSAGQMRTFTLGLANPATNYNILQEYNNTFNEQKGPNIAVGTPAYGDLPNMVKSTQELLDLQEDGDLPPYDAAGVQDDRMWVKVGCIGAGAYTASTSSQNLSTAVFKAPLGMVRLRFNNGTFSDTSDNMHVVLTAGDYRGLKADPI